MKRTRRRFRRLLLSPKWFAFAAATLGTTFQLSTCQQDASLFGLRWAFTSITLPINTFLRNLLIGIV